MSSKKERKIALVTGGSKGIGRATALALAADGFDIWLNYRSDEAAALTVQWSIQSAGQECVLLPFDVADNAAVQASLAPLLAEKDNVPFVLVNNAGFARDTMFGLMSETDWDSVLNVHLGGFFNVTRMVAPLMQRRRQGRRRL